MFSFLRIKYISYVCLLMLLCCCTKLGESETSKLNLLPNAQSFYEAGSKLLVQKFVESVIEAEEDVMQELNFAKGELVVAVDQLRKLQQAGVINVSNKHKEDSLANLINELENKVMHLEKILLSPDQMVEEMEEE